MQAVAKSGNSTLTTVTILLIFLMAVINQIFLISMVTILIKKTKMLIRSTARKYYCFVLFYIATKAALCVILQIKILTGIPTNFESLDSQTIESVFKNTLVFADCSVIELFMISFEYYLAMSFSILGNFKIEKLVRVLMQAMQLFAFFTLMIPLLIFNAGIISYELLNAFMCSLNCLSVVAFIASFFFMNFKMTGIMLDKKSSEIVKRVYKLLLATLISRTIMLAIEILVAINISNGSFEDYLSIIEANQGQFVTLGACFILYLVVILLSEGVPLIMSLRESIVLAFCESRSLRKSSNTEILNEDSIRDDLLTNFETEEDVIQEYEELRRSDIVSNLQDIDSIQEIEKISVEPHCSIYKGRFEHKWYFIRELGNISTYIVEDIVKEMEFFQKNDIKTVNKIKIFTKNNKTFLLEKFLQQNLDQKSQLLAKQPNPEKLILDAFIKIAKAIRELHNKNYAHGALSSKNIMFDELEEVTLTGFGLESLRKYLSLTSDYSNITMCTAVQFLGNERSKIVSKPSTAADVYSFSMILYEIFTGNRKYRELTMNQIRTKFMKENSRPKIPESMPEPLQKLLRKCWQENPMHRPSIQWVISSLESIKDEVY